MLMRKPGCLSGLASTSEKNRPSFSASLSRYLSNSIILI
jgi:radial spoke head protein 4/6